MLRLKLSHSEPHSGALRHKIVSLILHPPRSQWKPIFDGVLLGCHIRHKSKCLPPYTSGLFNSSDAAQCLEGSPDRKRDIRESGRVSYGGCSESLKSFQTKPCTQQKRYECKKELDGTEREEQFFVGNQRMGLGGAWTLRSPHNVRLVPGHSLKE